MSETALTSTEQAYFDTRGEETLEPTPAEPTTEPAPPARTETVPHAALHEERERRKELQARLDRQEREHREAMARVDERLQMLSRVTQPQSPPVPEFAQDPQGHIDARLRNSEQRAAAAEEASRKAAEQLAQQQALQGVVAWAQGQEAEFRGRTPDYMDAATHLRNARTLMLRTLGIPEQQIAQQVHAETLQVAMLAQQRGTNFAESIYNLARAAGYTPKQAAAAATNGETQMETVQRGQQLATGLSSSGSAPATKMTAERLAGMSEREFAAYYAKHEAEVNQLLDRG